MVEENREKKKRGNHCRDHNEVNVISDMVNSGSSSTFNPNDDVIIEILSRLPVKSLMKFKWVCKNWLFLIQEDTAFICLHFERSKARPHLLINNHTSYNKYTSMTFDILFGGSPGRSLPTAAVHTIREIDFSKCDYMLTPVNGLIGFFGETRIDPGVCICNVSTREVTPWLESKLLRDVREKDVEACDDFAMATCALGYDPVTKEHKVVGIWRSMEPFYTVCEVMTVGDNEWRQIDEVPQYSLELCGSYVYTNGSIYYSTDLLDASDGDVIDQPKFIVAFDVGSEKFRTIRLPNYIFGQPDTEALFLFDNIIWLELDGRLGLLTKLRVSSNPKLWLFDDDRNKKNSTSSWTQVSTDLPYIPDGDGSLNPIPGTNQIIVSSYVKTSDGRISDTTYRSYNWETKSWNEMEISGIPSSIPFFTSRSTPAAFFENLLPVRKRGRLDSF